MSSSRKSVPCPIAPATTIRFSSLPSLFISAGSIATTIRFNSRGGVVTARPESREQLLDQLLLISPLTNLFAELGGCLSDCGLGWSSEHSSSRRTSSAVRLSRLHWIFPLPSPLLGACFAVSSCGHEHACELWSTEKDDPMLAASALWAQTHPALAQPASAINGAVDGRF